MRCRACDAELAPQDQFCGACGAPRAPLPPRFAQIERQFAALRDRYRAGQLDEAAYDAALSELVVEDGSGYWMLGADSGAWYWHDGQGWVQRDPPAVDTPPRTTAPQPTAQPSRRRWWLIALPVTALLLCIVAAAVVLLVTPYGDLLLASAAIMLDEQDVAAYRARAAAYSDLGDHESAAADYGQAIALAPQDTSLLVQRAIHYSALGHYRLAIADLERTMVLDPSDCFAYLMRGRMYLRSGELALAREDYEQVLRFPDATCYSKPEAANALAGLGPAPTVAVPATTTPSPTTASEGPAATPASPPTATAIPQASPTPTVRTRELLYYNDFDTPQEPATGDAGQVTWEEGELRVSVSAPGRSIKAALNTYLIEDFRLHVTARPLRLDPGGSYGVAVRTDPALAEPGGGYWFEVRGDAQCRICVDQGGGAFECPSDWQICPAMPDEGNWIVIQGIGPVLRFTLNEVILAEVEDHTRADGAVMLWVNNDEGTSDSLVAFDDLAIFEP